jgi:6-phosphogluconolactonase
MLKKIILVALAGGAIACGQAFAQRAQFAYVVNQYSQYVEGYKVDPATGALIALPTSPYNTGLTDIFAMAADPVDGFLYVGNFGTSDSIAGFRIEPLSGELIPLAGSPFPAAPELARLAVAPSGRFLYATSPSNNIISVYRIDRTTGKLRLTQTVTEPSSAFFPGTIAVDPLGRFVYFANIYSGNVTGYSLNPTTGELTAIPGSPFNVAISGNGIAIDPLGCFAFVDAGAGVYVYAIDPVSGALSLLETPGSGAVEATVAAADPNGRFLYTGINGGIEGFSVTRGGPKAGSLTSLPGSPYSPGGASTDGYPQLLVIDDTGSYAYASYFSYGIVGFRIDHADGVLSLISSSPSYPSTGFSAIVLTRPRSRKF